MAWYELIEQRKISNIRVGDNIRGTMGDVPSFMRYRTIHLVHVFHLISLVPIHVCVFCFEYLLLPLPRLVLRSRSQRLGSDGLEVNSIRF